MFRVDWPVFTEKKSRSDIGLASHPDFPHVRTDVISALCLPPQHDHKCAVRIAAELQLTGCDIGHYASDLYSPLSPLPHNTVTRGLGRQCNSSFASPSVLAGIHNNDG